MKKTINEEGSEQIRKLLEGMRVERERMSWDEMVERVSSEGLGSVRRIDFGNRCLTDNVAFVNKTDDGRYVLLITDEKGNLTTNECFECAEEAYCSLVRRLERLKSYG